MSGWNFCTRCQQVRRKKVFVISAEGEITEPQYFQRLNSMSKNCVFYVVENLGNGSDPRHVLGRMKNYLRQTPLDKENEAWIVVDQDKWPLETIQELQQWSNETNRFCGISIRKFEDFLKLHLTGEPIALKKYKDFRNGKNKHLPDDFLTKSRVLNAIEQAKKIKRYS